MESHLHINCLELKAVLLALQQFEHQCKDQIVLVAMDNTTVVSYINKQGGYEVRLSLCPPVEASVLVPLQRYSPEGKAHSRSLECDSGQAFQTQSSDSNRGVPISAGVHSLMFQVDPTSGGLVCNPVQSQTTTVCLTGTGSDGLGS